MREHVLLFCLLGLVLTATIILVLSVRSGSQLSSIPIYGIPGKRS